MLRAISGGVAAMVLAGSAGAATIVNGDFETVSGVVGEIHGQRLDSLASPPGSDWDVFDAIPGWTTLTGNGVEVQTNATLGSIDAHSGRHYIELDSHPSDGRSNTKIGQTLGKLATGEYRLSFFYSPRTSALSSMGIEFGAFGGGSLTDTVQTGNVGMWSAISRSFLVTDSTVDTTIYFKAIGAADTLGGLIDTVDLERPAPVPAPAAGLLLVTGLAALGLFRRRPAA